MARGENQIGFSATGFNSNMVREKAAATLQTLLLLLLLLLFPSLALPSSAEALSPEDKASDAELSADDGLSEEVSSSKGEETAQILPPEESNFTGPCMGEAAFHRTWFDRTHSYLTSMLCQPSVWFDGFFGQHRAGEDWAGSLVRWRGSIRLDEQEGSEYSSEFRAQFRLPKMNKKVKLVITSESGDDQSSSHPDEDPYDLGPAGTDVGEESRTTAGLRYYLTDTRKMRINAGVGLKLGSSVQPYVRFRLRYTEPLGSSTLLRFIPSAIWLRDEGINRSMRIDLERRLSEDTLLRASQSFAREELTPGIQWGSVLTFYDRLSSAMVMALQAGIRGDTYPDNRIERYRLSARFRSNFLREWLFMEIEPEYYWPRDDQGAYHLYRAITFSLEMQFYS